MEPQEFKRQLVGLRVVITGGIAYFSAWRGLMVEDRDAKIGGEKRWIKH